jgi:hypothetical protein
MCFWPILIKSLAASQLSKPFFLMSGRVKDITQARGLIRTAFLNGWRGFRANDAIHLGSAQWVTKHVEVVAFYTYLVLRKAPSFTAGI